MNIGINAKIIIAVDAQNGVPYGDTLYSLRRAKGIDGVDIVIITEKKCYAPPYVNGRECGFVKTLDALTFENNNGEHVVFKLNSGDTVSDDAIERIGEFYGSHAVTEPIPDSVRSEFITACPDSLVDLCGSHKYLVSCVVPFHNAKDYLVDTLVEVTRQDMFSFGDVQLILVDDGSTDGNAEVAKEYLDDDDTRFDYVFISQEHKGISAAKNAGLVVADGAFVAFLDADCLMSERYLEVAVTRLQKRGDVDIVLFPTNVLCDGEEDIQLSDWRFGGNSVIDVSEEVWGTELYGAAAVIRADAIVSAGVRFDGEAEIPPDVDFLYRLLETNPKFSASAEACLTRCRRGASIAA